MSEKYFSKLISNQITGIPAMLVGAGVFSSCEPKYSKNNRFLDKSFSLIFNYKVVLLSLIHI